jgi:hypothetical protein
VAIRKKRKKSEKMLGMRVWQKEKYLKSTAGHAHLQ